MESLFSILNLDDLTPIQIVIFAVILWIKRDVRDHTRALNNGIVAKLENVNQSVGIFSVAINHLTEGLQAIRNDCLEHRRHFQEDINKLSENKKVK